MPQITRNGRQQEVSIHGMTSAEYKDWLYNNPEEAKKLDEPAAPRIATPAGLWRNGVWIELPNNTQAATNGVVKQ